MGLKTSPAILQKLMTKVLRGTEGFTASLSDDVVIFSDSWEDHLKNIAIVLAKPASRLIWRNANFASRP